MPSTILIVTDRTLFPHKYGNYGGNMVRIKTLAGDLRSLGHKVVLALPKTPENWRNRSKLRLFCDIHCFVPDGSEFQGGQLGAFDSSPYRAAVREAATEYKPSSVVAEYVWIAPCLDNAPNSAIKIIDTIDVFHTRQTTHHTAGVDPWVYCTRDEERERLLCADVVVAIQPTERSMLEALVPERRVITVMHNALATHCSRDSRPVRVKHPRVMVVGSYNYDNIHGITGFLTSVWPRIKEQVRDAELHVYGYLGKAVPERLPGVRRQGYVRDLTKAYTKTTVVVNPTSLGSGLKIKTVEALAHGKAVVCTPAGAAGLEHLDGHALRVAGSDKEFAASVTELLRSGATRLALEEHAREYASRNLTRAAVYGELLGVLNGRSGAAVGAA